MTSAAARVFAIPELLELILLCLPVRKQGGRRKPDFHLYVLRRVNRAFNDAMNRPSMTMQQLQTGRSVNWKQRFAHYKLPFWLNRKNIWPDLDICKVDESCGTYRFETLTVRVDQVGVAHVQEWRKSWKGPPSERFTRPEASWRKLPIHPTMKVEAIFPVELFNSSRELFEVLPYSVLNYIFHADEEWPSSNVGELCDFISKIRSLMAEQHIWFFKQAALKRSQRFEAHLTAERDMDGVLEPEARIAGCELCAGKTPSLRGCDICKHFLHDEILKTWGTGIPCCRASRPLTIFWPMHRDLFDHIDVIDEKGRPLIYR